MNKISIPNNSGSRVSSIGENAFKNCTTLEYFFQPPSSSINNNYAFNSCYSLREVILYGNKNTKYIPSYTCNGASNLVKATIKEGVQYLGAYCFQSCASLAGIILPSTITSIGANAFAYCSTLKKLDCTKLIAIPTLSNTNAFTSTHADLKIIVPDDLYEDWIVATNWSTYASKIVKESEA